MNETELKLQVPVGRQALVDAEVAGRTPAPRMRLQAAYHDTPARTLAEAGMALRLRREGRQWVQTLKGAGDDSLTRAEHNVPRGTAAEMPAIDLSLHAGTPVGDRLIALLGPESALQTLYRTDIRRRTRALVVRTPGQPAARVELAFDRGRIVAGSAPEAQSADPSIQVCELEIELLAGSPLAVIDTARRWLPRFGLWMDLRSKAERGDLLARGERMAPARTAGDLQLAPAMTADEAWQTVLRHCAEQILANASQIASGEHMPAHVHQLRVGLRRLRSALAFFERTGDAALGDGAATLFRGLGAARDGVVIEGEFGAALGAAMQAAGLGAETAPPATAVDAALPARLVRDAATQAWLLDLLAAMHVAPVPVEASDELPLRDALAVRLRRWHRQVTAGAKRYAELNDEARHRLRKRAKRLRYAAEFSAALFGQRPLRRYLKRLRALQEQLGAISDVVMAMSTLAPRATSEPTAMFALGWLAARRDLLIASAQPELDAFVKAEPFWKKKQAKKRGRRKQKSA